MTDPSYELMDDHNRLSIIYHQHGFPCLLVRWHFHKEYEVHLSIKGSTRAGTHWKTASLPVEPSET